MRLKSTEYWCQNVDITSEYFRNGMIAIKAGMITFVGWSVGSLSGLAWTLSLVFLFLWLSQKFQVLKDADVIVFWQLKCYLKAIW